MNNKRISKRIPINYLILKIIYSDNKKYILYKLNLIKSNALKLFNKYYVKIVEKINK